MLLLLASEQTESSSVALFPSEMVQTLSWEVVALELLVQLVPTDLRAVWECTRGKGQAELKYISQVISWFNLNIMRSAVLGIPCL